MKIYTKTGDIGETSLFGGKRLLKSNLRIEAYGTVDELNSFIGLVRDVQTNKEQLDILKEVQDRLFTIGATLASAPDSNAHKAVPDLYEDDVVLLETAIDNMDKVLPPITHFVLPGGHVHVSYCHIARTVCRRAERLVVALNSQNEIAPLAIKYLNRLSDYLFVLGRKMAYDLQVEEVKWFPRKKKDGTV